MGDEAYNKTLENLQQYIPFLDNMIVQLKDPNKKNREQQLNKMQSLHAMITDKRKKLKLETLIKCEDVISKLYEKVHNKPINSKKDLDNMSSTPASPSPPRDTLIQKPLTIPTERLEENRIPRIDIYSSAGESLSRSRQQQSVSLGARVPDMSKPPISLEDLKTLEDDVHEKINENSLNAASLCELNSLKEKLTEQIHIEEVLMKSPQKNKKGEIELIDTTARNNLNLTKKVIQPPDKVKSKESSKSSPNKHMESTPSTSSPKKEHKSGTSTNKSPKILKEPDSIFGSILSHIDHQILECKKKKEERRNSLTGKDEKKSSDKDLKKKDRKLSVSSDTNDEKKDIKDKSLTENKHKSKDEKKSKSSKESGSKKKERHHHQSGDKNTSKDDTENDIKEEKKDNKVSNKEIHKDNSFSLTGKKSFEAEEEKLKKNLLGEGKLNKTNENIDLMVTNDNDNKSIVGKISVKKELGTIKSDVVDNKEDPAKPTTFKRLADKYNPKPRKTTSEPDIDKEVSEIIEEKMKTSPPKLPLINQIPAPIPPPPSLLLCSQVQPEATEPTQKLSTVLSLAPGTTELINNVVNQLRQNNAETESMNVKLNSMHSTSSLENFVSDYVREDTFNSDYSKENFSGDDFSHNLQIKDFNNFSTSQLRRDKLTFEPPSIANKQFSQVSIQNQPSVVNNQFNQVSNQSQPSIQNKPFNQGSNQNQRFMMSPLSEGFNDHFPTNRPFTPMPQGFSQPFSNFQSNQNQSMSADIQPLDYYPPNAPVPSNQYNSGPPLLSPEIPGFHNEQKCGNFGMMSNHDMFAHNEDIRWRQEDNRFSWERRDPRTYREYREMRESREPRVTNRDPRENRDLRDPRAIRDPRVNRDLRDHRDPRDRDPRDRDSRDRDSRDRDPRDRDSRDRDPRLNKDRDFDYERSRFRDSRSQTRDVRPSRYDSKFDRMYSRTNRDRSRSRSRSRSYSKESFASPLDSLYTEKEKHSTGKGYGVQNFRIPRIKKEDEEKEQSTKVTSTNEDISDSVHVVNDDSIDTVHNEVTGNHIDTEEVPNIEQNQEVDKNEQEEENENETNEKLTEVEKTVEELPKLNSEVEETKEDKAPILTPATQTPDQDEAKPADQTILAQFFANLLGSQNKKDKKTALYSLISTFADTFSQKELSKITKIIKADDEAETSEEEEDTKKPEQLPVSEISKEPEKNIDTEETPPVDSPVKANRRTKRRIRRISSAASLKDETHEAGNKDNKEEVKTLEPPETPTVEESVVVTVGERIKSRKRCLPTPPKPKKKCKTELDMLHEDIQEMFIRDGVLTASGKRMCRILKSDPSALTGNAETQKIRRKPGPKSKQKLHASEMNSFKNIRVLIPKIPDSNFKPKEESPRRNLRSAAKASYAESEDEDDSIQGDDDSVEVESLKGEDSDAESTDTETDKVCQATDTSKTKITKRKRGKGWASGNIPSSKKKKKKQLPAEELECKTDNDATGNSDTDKSFVEPDKNCYIDFVTNKSQICKLCNYKGIRITQHYKTQHPESEVLTSRFSPAVALEAIEDSRKNLTKYEKTLRVHGGGKFHYTCRFCAFNTTVPPTIFYDHITTHTGEYRHICPMCDFSAPSGKTLKSHMSNIHNNADRRVARKSYSETILFGYMCGECNYVQLNQKHIEDHINIFHLQKPKIYKVNLSTVVDSQVVALAETETEKDSVEVTTVEEKESEEKPPAASKEKKNKAKKVKAMPPPKPKKRAKPGPKERLKAKQALADKEEHFSDTGSITGSETSNDTESEQVATPVQSPAKSTPVGKRRQTREASVLAEEELNIISGRSRRAAKDKATEKLKTLMELTENGQKKKPISNTGNDDRNRKENIENKKEESQVVNKPESESDQQEPEKESELPVEKPEPVVKKEVELNVFTCKTDIQEENKKIEQERLQLMEELNKSVGSRTSLNFVDKLCDRLSNNDIIVKQEPRDDLTDNLFLSNTYNSSPLTMPVLEKSLPVAAEASTSKALPTSMHTKKPVLETENIQTPNSSFDVTQKNDKLITDMIQKLKGKLASISDDKSESSATLEDIDYDSEGPPPLTHVNELPNVKPADGSTKILLIGGLVKVIKYPNSLVFSCLVPPCVFSTENEKAFQKHCSEAHKLQDTSTLCEMCGMEIVSTAETTLLESIFKHALNEHADFTNGESKTKETEEKEGFVKPGNTPLRIRKLSGDALSIKKDWDEEIDKATSAPAKNQDTNHENQSTPEAETVDEPGAEPEPTMAVLDMSDDNPFPFKISGVMSLAEPLPPLTPIAPTQIVSQLIVKEAKLTTIEITKPRKTVKAMVKFISGVGDLYKCPHYYCLFSTNFRDFLDRHLKAHKFDPGMMIPCVYCDMKTPWEHVPMHIDIRHAHCRFACSYCLYRAVVKEYVFLHQDQMHPENDYSVIALPQAKNCKKWAIADAKIDPKQLCEPYKCSIMCGLEFLFENEFRRHLLSVHKTNFITCGYKSCAHRIQANKMVNHWTLCHGVSVYQCGYCKTNSYEMRKLYLHCATNHQGLVPDILIRKLTKLQEGVTLGYTPEAFTVLRKVVTIPSNISGDNKLDLSSVEPKTVPVILPSLSNKASVIPQPKPTFQIVPTIQPVGNVIFSTGSKSLLKQGLTLVTKPPTSSANSIIFLPAASTSITMSSTATAPSETSTTFASTSVASSVTVVASVPSIVTTAPVMGEPVTVQKDDGQGKDVVNIETDSQEAVAPLEHITLTAEDEEEDNNQINEDTDPCEADPLSLDMEADLNDGDASKLAADSSGDESDGNKLEKSKKQETIGLLGYQLYRCAFCDISFSNSVDFRRHATYSLTCRKDDPVAKPFLCVHCGRQLKNPSALVEHIQCHGILRFTCSLCGSKFPSGGQTRGHIKNRHNISHTCMTPLNPAKQDIDVDEYVVKPKLTLQKGTSKDTSLAEVPDVASATENVYTPETIEQIPMRHILSSMVKCGLCSYTTKVRTNMVRHLQFHSEEKAVPDTAPVNPVPCLEKNEKMFDKMINLASSSHANSRMGGSKPEKEVEKYPEFIPSHCRYVCCAHGCSYMCPEEGNLRHHLIALHDSETLFTCVHCKMNLTPTDADNLIKHFKLHGLQLYKCQYCSFIHNLKHKVEKHVADNHLDLTVKVVTIRFMESEPKDFSQETSTSGSQVPAAPAASGKIYKPWRCCMCKYKSGTEKGIQNHVLEKHEIDSQFKCALCSYKTNDKETFADHFKDIHDNQTIDMIDAYRKMEEDKEKESDTFDTTPLWQRDRPRIRHIRGILFDESTPTYTKSPKKIKSVSAASSPGPSGAQIVALPPEPSPETVGTPPAATILKIVTPTAGPSSVNLVTPSPSSSGVKITSSSATPSSSKSTNLDLSIESVVNGTADILKESSAEVSDDFFHTVNKLMKDSTEDIAKLKDSVVIVIEDEDEAKTPVAKDKDNKDAPVAKNRHLKRKGIEVPGISKIVKMSDEIIDLDSGDCDADLDELSERSLKVRFGGLGAPLWRQLKCPVCNLFKSKRISDFVFHLFKEMKIFRFKCKVCTDESITYRYMYKHVRDHKMGENCTDHIKFLPPDEKMLTWLQMVIREQSVSIMQNYPKTPQPATMGSALVQCNFCKERFQTEQERNEHSIIHWITKPYRCAACAYDSYSKRGVQNHFKATHQEDVGKTEESAMAVLNGLTVETLLKMSDDQHISETNEGRKDLKAATVKDEQNAESQDVTAPAASDEAENKGDDPLSDSDLIIVTKTESEVPTDTDVFCCRDCPFMTNSQPQIDCHVSNMYSHKNGYKKLDRIACENPSEHVGCMLCPEIGSEIKIRQHFTEKHEGSNFGIYRLQCSLCQKRFLIYPGLKMHFNKMHQGHEVVFTTLYDTEPGSKTELKKYKCPQCPYERNLKPNMLNNMRQHLKQHFKAFKCGLCPLSVRYKTRADVAAHCSKEHGGKGMQVISQDAQQMKRYTTTMAEIIATAVDVRAESLSKNTARKSTSAPHMSRAVAEYSFYGNQPEEVDLTKIMTSVEINGMHLSMSAEKLSKLFDLDVTVAVEDCNLAVNLSSVFDS